jgi:esterase/lipase
MANEKFFTFLGIVILLLMLGCAQQNENAQNAGSLQTQNDAGSDAMQKVSFTTEDGIKISANYWPSKSDKGVVLLHMLGRTKETWASFPEKLNKAGFNAIAIDMRGHGESKGRDFRSFTTQQWINALKDIKAAKEFLAKKGVDANSTYLIGGSIGANLSLNYAAQDNSIKKIVLLSPGLDYRGVITMPSMQKYNGAVFLAASSEDVQSFDGTKQLYGLAKGGKEIKEFDNAGHGTNMLGKNNLDEDIIAWLKK